MTAVFPVDRTPWSVAIQAIDTADDPKLNKRDTAELLTEGLTSSGWDSIYIWML